MKIRRRFFAIIMSAVLMAVPALNLSASGVSEAQREKETLEKELDEAKKLIEDLKDSREGIESKVRDLDARLTDIAGRIWDLEKKMAQTNDQIDDTKGQLSQAESDEAAQYENMKLRIRYMYENSMRLSPLEVFFSADSLTDFLGQTEYIRQITNYDRKMLKKYEETKRRVADAKSALELDLAQLKELKEQVAQEQQSVKLLLAAKEEELNAVNNDLSDAQADADAMAAEIQAQEDIIAQIQAEEARKEAARKAAEAERLAKEQEKKDAGLPTEGEESGQIPTDIYSGGIFVWPCPGSTRVTSDYGARLSPTAGASSDHKGIDIGADYGAAIVAAADGTVTYAGYNSGMGNYVMISHGSGLYTVYGHCCALMVQTGDTVSAGQTIAQVGSTGISTGNHLHFGVSKDGSYVSPWNYLG